MVTKVDVLRIHVVYVAEHTVQLQEMKWIVLILTPLDLGLFSVS